MSPSRYAKNEDISGEAAVQKEPLHSKLLVLCIDRDDDIGSKGGIETPIVGRDSCINAGTRLALEDPEDADSNAIFGAVKTYEELVSKGYTAEVAIVAGKYNRGVEADEKISFQVKSILEKYHADGAVIVSDGEDDETVLPVIQSRLPVISVQRVIIKHSRTVEYSYAVLGKYLKMLVYDSQYSKFFLGVPGILLVAAGIAVAFDATKEITVIMLGILGSAFLIRAFDVDKALGSLGRLTPTSFIKIFSIIGGVLIILASIANGISSIPASALKPGINAFEVLTSRVIVGDFARGTITLLWIGIATILGGILLSNWFKGSARALSDTLKLVVLALLFIPMQQFTSVLTESANPFTLISSLLIGLAVSLVAATFLFQYFRNRKGGEVLKH
jgi:putative membrane protein